MLFYIICRATGETVQTTVPERPIQMVEVDLDQASLVLYLEEGHGDDLVDLEDLADLVNQAGLEDLVHFLENDFDAMPCC